MNGCGRPVTNGVVAQRRSASSRQVQRIAPAPNIVQRRGRIPEGTIEATVRRIVTGHGDDGRAVVQIDRREALVPRRERVASRVLWTSAAVPADNAGSDDAADVEIGLTIAAGTVFRVVQFEPGNPEFLHRTASVDYAVVIDGEIDMELDEGESVHLEAGDLLVQRGTIHGFVNRGSAPCRIAFVLVSAAPVEVAGRVLGDFVPD
jgi:quercetin dioxygenase-like cupin family protein